MNSWSNIQSKINNCEEYINDCSNLELLALVIKLIRLKSLNQLEKIRQLNRYVNMHFGHNIDKTWAHDLSFIENPPNSGVLSVLKYFLLKRLDIQTNKMRLVSIRHSLTGGSDSLLAINLDGEVYILK